MFLTTSHRFYTLKRLASDYLVVVHNSQRSKLVAHVDKQHRVILLLRAIAALSAVAIFYCNCNVVVNIHGITQLSGLERRFKTANVGSCKIRRDLKQLNDAEKHPH